MLPAQLVDFWQYKQNWKKSNMKTKNMSEKELLIFQTLNQETDTKKRCHKRRKFLTQILQIIFIFILNIGS